MPRQSRSNQANSSQLVLDLSGLTGGPGTFSGTDYQINYAIYQALDMLAQVSINPSAQLSINLEPRGIAPGDWSRWDVSFGRPLRAAEVKIHPTRDDIRAWLERIASTRHLDDEPVQFEFVHGRDGGPLHKRLDELIRAAKSCDSVERFNELVGMYSSDADVVEALASLGDHAFSLLRRMQVMLFPPLILEEQISDRSRAIAGEIGGRNLTNFLFEKFSAASNGRIRFRIGELISELALLGIELEPVATKETIHVSASGFLAMAFLQACPDPIPGEIVVQAAGTSLESLVQDLALQMSAGTVSTEPLWSIQQLPQKFKPKGLNVALSRGLSALLAYVDVHRKDAPGLSQVRNAVSLAGQGASTDPALVAQVFLRLDKLLKTLGDKREVLRVAELSISAARREDCNRTLEVIRGETHALICGRAWVFQRTGRLDEARIAAQQSLQLGEDIGWDLNTAFCKKCMGRLDRMEAERNPRSNRRVLLAQSESMLKEAASRFAEMRELEEVGDCTSLLGRTYLIMGRLHEADRSVRDAYNLVRHGNGKDFIDLVILTGELALNRGCPLDAIERYDEALKLVDGNGIDESELRARARLHRARAYAKLGRTTLALEDYATSSEMYRCLDELEWSAIAEWEAHRLRGEVPDELGSELESESFLVRVLMIRQWLDSLSKRPTSAIAFRRALPSRQRLNELIAEARRQAATETRVW
jgi:tetratricopeptide (TPR) repeat protein